MFIQQSFIKVKMRSLGRLKKENDTISDQSYCTIQLHSNYTVLFYESIIFPLIYIRDIRKKCAKAKDELSANLHTRLRYVVVSWRKKNMLIKTKLMIIVIIVLRNIWKKLFALNCRAGYFNKAQPKFNHVLNPLQFHDKFECWVLRVLLSNMERF